MNILLNIASETFRLFFEMSPYLILGFFFSGLLHIVIGEKYIKKHFSKGGIIAAVKAALFGIPLPVCSCGVIPLAESMNRDGASKSSTMAFWFQHHQAESTPYLPLMLFWDLSMQCLDL